jgi:hypothetical protein
MFIDNRMASATLKPSRADSDRTSDRTRWDLKPLMPRSVVLGDLRGVPEFIELRSHERVELP